MATATVKSEGWTLDRVVWEALQDPAAALVEEALRLNPQIASHGVVLPVGTVVNLPETPARTPVRTIVRLWD